MRANIRSCLEQCLADKFKVGTTISAVSWFDVATANLHTAAQAVSSDPNGAIMLIEAAMLKVAKGLAAMIGVRIERETHTRMVDFLSCVFHDDLTDSEKGALRRLATSRNTSMYDDPQHVDTRSLGNGFNAVQRMLDHAYRVIATGP